MRLSKNFTLEEFLVSQTAERHGIDMTPPTQVIANLERLVTTCLQPLRDHVLRPISISSGYRPATLNKRIGGSPTSAHQFGNAADFKVIGQTPYDTCQAIVQLELPFDQLIHEFGRWVHLGIAARELRGQELTAARLDGQTQYLTGIRTMESLA